MSNFIGLVFATLKNEGYDKVQVLVQKPGTKDKKEDTKWMDDFLDVEDFM